MGLVAGQFSQLLAPGLAKAWHQLTGHMADITYEFDSDTYRISFSQGFYIRLSKTLLQEMASSTFLIDLLNQIANSNLQYGTSSISVKIGENVHDLPLSWKPQPEPKPYTATQALTEQYELAQTQQANDLHQTLLNDYVKHVLATQSTLLDNLGAQPAKPDNRVRVYDLGDGMLVPVELCELIVQMIQHQEKPKPAPYKSQYHTDPNVWFITDELIKDAESSKKSIASKILKPEKYFKALAEGKDKAMWAFINSFVP